MDKTKGLLLASGIILLTTTATFLLLIPDYDSNIYKIQSDINELNEQIYTRQLNINLCSDQLVKISSTRGTYEILKELNSSQQNDWENHLRAQYIMLIKMVAQENTDIDYLSTLSIEELEERAESEVKLSNEEYNKLVHDKNTLDETLNLEIEKRNKLNRDTAIVQLFGLFLGILGSSLKKS